MTDFDVMLPFMPVLDVVATLNGTFPIEGDKTRMLTSYVPEPCGGGGTTALTFTRMGGKFLILCPFGTDDNSQFMMKGFIENGLSDVGFKIDENYIPPVAVCVIDDNGTHTFMSEFKIADKFPMDTEQLFGFMDRCKALCLSGYSLIESESGFEELNRALFLRAKEQGKPVFFDVGPLVSSIDSELLESALQSSYMVLMNREEAKVLSGVDDLELAARRLSERTDAIVIAKAGVDGCFLQEKGKPGKWFPSFDVPFVDTCGCGDSFWGAIMYACLKGFNIDTAVILASAAGSVMSGKLGTGTNCPQFDETFKLLVDNGYEIPQINKELGRFESLDFT